MMSDQPNHPVVSETSESSPSPSLALPSLGQPQYTASGLPHHNTVPIISTSVPSAGSQNWLSSEGQSGNAPAQESIQSSASFYNASEVTTDSTEQAARDWQEHTTSNGRRYYYNRRTKQSSWDKPPELMTPIERADASTDWKEFTTPEGKKYYYNKFTNQSKWTMPEELKLAREQAQHNDSPRVHSGSDHVANTDSSPNSVEMSSASIIASAGASFPAVVSSSIPVSAKAAASTTNTALVDLASSAAPNSFIPATANILTSIPAVDFKTEPLNAADNLSSHEISNGGVTSLDAEEEDNNIDDDRKEDVASFEEKMVDEEHLVFTNKLDAKNAFKSLLESVHVQSDWTWEQTMKEIINDKRYGALKTPGERKQAFNEYLGQRKKVEAEEKRVRQKKAREEYTKMLEECKELTSAMKWSKAVSLFENDHRFKAVEKPRDREELFDTYIVELHRKEREKAVEDHKKNIAQFRIFLESCDFIKVNTSWRKIQDRLEDDERCLRIEKLDRLLTFQDYIRDLEREEEEQKKIQKEHQRRVERKNRDAFRHLLEEHVATGILTAKTYWLDYCAKVKDIPEYQGVAGNLSGTKPKDLFEDVLEELENQYHEDKILIKDLIKSKEIAVNPAWAFEDFKTSIADEHCSSISNINLKLLYDDIVGKAKEREEKEAKKRLRLADDFTEVLYTFKEISSCSTWEECKPLFEDSQEYRSFEEESSARSVFEEYITYLLEKAKEKERKREEEKEREEKEKRKEKKEKRSRKDEGDAEEGEERKKEKDKSRKHRKRHRSGSADGSSDKEDDESKKSRRHGSDRKKSRKHLYASDSDGEIRHKKHKKDQRKNEFDELEDGEFHEDPQLT